MNIMLELMTKAAFEERFGNCVGEQYTTISEADRQAHRDMVRAALLAATEPTDEMLEAAINPYKYKCTDEFNEVFKKTVAGYWKAMIAVIAQR